MSRFPQAGDHVRLPRFQPFAGRAKRDGRERAGGNQPFCAVGNLWILLDQELDMVLIPFCGRAAHYLVNEIYGSRGANAADYPDLEDCFGRAVLPRNDVLRIREIRINHRDAQGADFIRDECNLCHAWHDDICALCDKVLARFAQKLDWPTTQVSALYAVRSVNGFRDEIDVVAQSRMNNLEPGCRKILFEQPPASGVVRGQHAHATNSRELPSNVAANGLYHVNNLQRRVGFQLVDEGMTEETRQHNRRHASLLKAANHVENIEFSLRRRFAARA